MKVVLVRRFSYSCIYFPEMYGKTSTDMVMVDMIMDTLVDMFDPFVTANFTKDEAQKVNLIK